MEIHQLRTWPDGFVCEFNDDTGSGSNSRIRTQLPEDGYWTFEVSSFSPRITGTYKVTVNGCAAAPR